MTELTVLDLVIVVLCTMAAKGIGVAMLVYAGLWLWDIGLDWWLR